MILKAIASNIISYEDHLIEKVNNEYKWYVFIRMEYAVSLKKYLISKKLTEEDVIQLGIDLCNALEFLLTHQPGIKELMN